MGEMKPCGRCGNETHEDELKFNFGVCDGCDQHRDGLRFQQDDKKASNDRAFHTGWAVVKSGYRLYVSFAPGQGVEDYNTGFRTKQELDDYIRYIKREMSGMEYGLRIEPIGGA